MRKFFSLTLVAVLALTLALAVMGCAKKEETATPSSETTPAPTTTPAAPDTSAGAGATDTSSHM